MNETKEEMIEALNERLKELGVNGDFEDFKAYIEVKKEIAEIKKRKKEAFEKEEKRLEEQRENYIGECTTCHRKILKTEEYARECPACGSPTYTRY